MFVRELHMGTLDAFHFTDNRQYSAASLRCRTSFDHGR